MTRDAEAIRARITESLRELGYEPAELCADIAFHMTDWLDDLARWSAFCDSPSSLSAKQLEAMLLQFLLHVPNHVAAASKLMADVPVTDIFEVGAVGEADEA